MRELVDFLHYDDFLAISVVLLILYYLGWYLATDLGVRRWSARIAVTTLVGHAALQGIVEYPSTAGELLPILCRSLCTGAFALSLSWIGLTILRSIYSLTLEPLRRRLRTAHVACQMQAEQRRQERQAAQAQKRAQMDWEASAPERERARLEGEQRALQAHSAQKRREDARLECELFYTLLAADISERFPRSEFDQFVKRYMRDDLAPLEVEGRGRQLRTMIQQHVDKVQPPPKFTSLQSLAAWFQEQRSQIEAVADERMRRNLSVRLNERYAELTAHLLEEMGA